LLLENKAQIDIQNNNSNTALHLSSLRGDINLVRLLLERGANIEQKTNQEETALDIAKKLQKTEITNLLNQRNQPSQSFEDSIRANNLELADQLLSQGAVFNKSILATEDLKAKFTKFVFYAVENNKTDLIKILIKELEEKFFDLVYYENNIIPYVLITYKEEKKYLLKTLLTEFEKLKGSKFVGSFGFNPFHYLSSISSKNDIGKITDLIDVLHQLNYDINATSNAGNTVIHNMMNSKLGSGISIVINKLIERGLDINKTTRSGDTALHIAVQCKNIEAIKALLEKGADYNIKNVNNITPLELATKSDNKRIDERIKNVFQEMIPSLKFSARENYNLLLQASPQQKKK
jgi:ankyrin